MATQISPNKHARAGAMIQLTVGLCPKVLLPCHCSRFGEFETACDIISMIFLIIYIGSVGKAMGVITPDMRTLHG